METKRLLCCCCGCCFCCCLIYLKTVKDTITQIYDSDGSDDTDINNDDGLDEPYLKAEKRKWNDRTKIFDINCTW